jgi:hypothetical protein
MHIPLTPKAIKKSLLNQITRIKTLIKGGMGGIRKLKRVSGVIFGNPKKYK